MNSYHRPGRSTLSVCLAALAVLMLLISCEPPAKRPVGPAHDYADAKDLFKKGNIDRTLQYTEGLAEASPPNDYTERARVMRVIIFSGGIKAHTELAEAYGKGNEKAKNPRFKAEYGRLRSDSLQYGAKAALGLGETAHLLTGGAGLGKEVTLELPYPDAEGPVTITQLTRVTEGGWIEPEDQESASNDAQRKGIDEALAEAVGGDRAKARTALSAGAVKIDGAAFALFLGRKLLAGANLFDRKHYNDYQKFKLMTGEADEAAQAALAFLKDKPDKDKEKDVKKLQADIQAAIKKFS